MLSVEIIPQHNFVLKCEFEFYTFSPLGQTIENKLHVVPYQLCELYNYIITVPKEPRNRHLPLKAAYPNFVVLFCVFFIHFSNNLLWESFPETGV